MVLGAYRLGLSTYNERLLGQGPGGRVRARQHAERAAISEISLRLGVSRTMAGKWSRLGEMLAEFPKIREAYLDGDFSTHRMSLLVRAAAAAPKGDLQERFAEAAEDAIGHNDCHDDPTHDKDAADKDPADKDVPDGVDPTADAGESGGDAGSDADATTADDVDDTPADDADPDAGAGTGGVSVTFEDIALELGHRATTDTAA
ncbi:hypothetical protein V1Y59_03170 [Gordonia sp. PKS22-38]|uniref:Uncharacterized protein n=1 Tax=Gordonia prachuapensis TaxID=3115651 RepID=A0ABU7MP19_9ACTN|nr:hypothetical protein [Gordonia sp. PKS22-38]